MTLYEILSFSFVALLLVISPGPNGVLIAKTVSTSGKKAGFANVAGFLAAFYLHGALSVLGISVILTKSAELFMIVKVIGAMYLIWLGLKSLFSALKPAKPLVRANEPVARNSLKKSFLEGFLTNGLNPKVSMFYLAAFPQFIPLGEHAIAFAFLLVFIHSTLNLLWFSSLVVLFQRVSHAAKGANFKRILDGVTGIIFVSFGMKLASLEAK